MRMLFSKKILAMVISTILFPSVTLASSDTVILDGTGLPDRNDSILQQGGSSGVHNLVVKNYNIIDFQSGNTFKGMNIPSIISLGVGNSTESNPNYGDLSLTVLDSVIKGRIDNEWLWGGLYLRSDTEGSTIVTTSNSNIDLTVSQSPGGWLQGAAIYTEHKGEEGHSEVVLSEGSDITLTLEAPGVAADYNPAVLAYANLGTTAVTAEKNTLITTQGLGATGIKTYSRDGSNIVHAGTINSLGDAGNGISAHAAEDSKGVISIANLADGVINMAGNSSSGIRVFSAGTGDISIYNAGKITLEQGYTGDYGNTESSAILMQTYADQIAAENITMTAVNDGEIVVKGVTSHGIHAESNMDSGTMDIRNNGLLTVDGSDSFGIKAMIAERLNVSGTAEMLIVNSGTLSLGAGAANSKGIFARNSEMLGDATVWNQGKLTIAGSNSDAISMFGGNNATVINQGLIATADGSAILAESNHGETLVVNQGDILAASLTGSTPVYGINAISYYGTAGVYYETGTLKVSGENSTAIAVSGSNGQSVQLASGTHVDAAAGLGGVAMTGSGEGVIAIASGATVSGGAKQGYGVKFADTTSTYALGSGAQYTLENAGSIGALSDLAIAIDDTNGRQVTLNNYGDITGYLNAVNSNTTLNNYHTLNLRSFSDTNGDGERDTKQVALLQFGEGDNQVNNAAGALIQLAAVQNAGAVDTTGMYSAQGTKSIATAGINQAQLLNVDTFHNAGTLNLAVNQLAGDLLAITANSELSGQSAHAGGAVTSGGGSFISDGGFLLVDTVLNEGGSASQSDVLVVDNAQTGSAATRIRVNQVGGKGAVTSEDGILVVDVLGASEQNAFTLAGGPLKAGAYEYTLEQGSLLDPNNQSFYLRTSQQQLNPDIGSYLANQAMATGLFMHSLHDRLGEPQYLERFKGDERAEPGMWIRAVASNTKSDAAGRSLSVDSNNRVVHLGGDLTQWDTEHGDRYHFGLMGAWGRADSVSRSKSTGSSARSKVEGYGAGAYLTWYDNAEQAEGWYSDLWSMYSWFNNSAENTKDYRSRAWTTSLETGYASTVKPFEKWRWMVEPQGQISYTHYSASTINDRNGLLVNNDDASGVATRLGIRTYLQPTDGNEKAQFQPFLTVNWLWSDANNSMSFNNTTYSSDIPKNRFEAKLGLQAEVRQNTHIYGQISGLVGENNYTHKAAQLGLRYEF